MSNAAADDALDAPREHLNARRRANILKASGPDGRFRRCFQLSSGHSSSPEGNVFIRPVWDRRAHHGIEAGIGVGSDSVTASTTSAESVPWQSCALGAAASAWVRLERDDPTGPRQTRQIGAGAVPT